MFDPQVPQLPARCCESRGRGLGVKLFDPLSLDGFAVVTFCFHPPAARGELISFRPREFSAGMPGVGKPVMFLLSSGLSCVWLLDLFLLDRLVTERIQNPWERMERVIQKL